VSDSLMMIIIHEGFNNWLYKVVQLHMSRPIVCKMSPINNKVFIFNFFDHCFYLIVGWWFLFLFFRICNKMNYFFFVSGQSLLSYTRCFIVISKA
jgi:hypothetical protein